MLDDLIIYRLAPERYLLVINAANHRRDLEWFQQHAEEFPRREVRDVSAASRCWPSRARRPRDRAAGERAAAAAHAGGHAHARRRGGAGEPDRLHRRGRRRARLRARGRRPLWDALLARGATPAASAPATRCGSRSATRCTATTSRPRGTRSSRARLRLRARAPTSPAPRPCAEARRTPAAADAGRLRRGRAGDRRAGMAIEGGGEVTTGSLSPMLQRGSDWLRAARARRRGRAVADRRPRPDARWRRQAQTALQKGPKE